MNEKITINGKFKPEGIIKLPPSKSLSHRALICGALGGKGSIIKNLETDGEDIGATLACLEVMGLKYHWKEGDFFIDEGIEKFIKDKDFMESKAFNCGESGSTLRFLIPLLLVSGASVVVEGRGRLMERPIDDYLEAFRDMGGKFNLTDGKLHLRGPIKAGVYRIPGDVSSQYISGLLMAMPLLNGPGEIRLTTKLESKPYVDMTAEVMERFGVSVRQEQEAFKISDGESFKPADYRVEGDYSQGAFFLVAGALGSPVACEGLYLDSLQGDKEILEFIRRCGGTIEEGENGCLKATSKELRGITVDISQCPDLAPPLAVLLCFCKGESKIVGAGRLKMKESDRLESITRALGGIGAKIIKGNDFLIISGVDEIEGGIVDPFNDHRIAMAGAIASIKSRNPVIVKNPGCVKKSYPNFWRDFCGGNFKELE
jgi:3-phosphoshikimate 1-carboxyvinyltransferase